MAPPTSILSKTLKSISVTKINEITKQRAKYERRKDAVLTEAAQHADDPHRRIARLLRGVEDLYPAGDGDIKVDNVKFWVQQSKFDASVPPGMLASCEELLRGKLEVQSRRLALAHLYSRLVTEWMEPGIPMSGEIFAASDDSFEVVDRQKERLQELCDRFEEVVFSPLDTDEVEIDQYLSSFFRSEDSKSDLEELREDVCEHAHPLMTIQSPFNNRTLGWSINALLAEDLLSDEKQAILREFLDNDIVLGEIADVLNMRFAEFDSWEWDAGEQGIPVLPRPQLNGKYRIWMDEDVLQAIFVEFIGIRCCNFLHKNLSHFLGLGAWRWDTDRQMSPLDALRRRYYLGGDDSKSESVNHERETAYKEIFFLSQLPATPTALSAGAYVNDGEVEGDDEGKGWSNIKQRMLRTLAAEVTLHRALRSEAAVVQTDLQWYATGLSHATIFAVMRFVGFPDPLIEFYRKVLQAPLNMSPTDGNPRGPRTRRRGVPMAHATEKFIGELVLFVMDLVVNRETGMLLYRLHDDIFLVGEPERCARAWKAMGTVANVLGLQFNMHKTGSVYLTDRDKTQVSDIAETLPKGPVQIGHLTLDPASGEWVIDQKQVGEHVAQLKKQLGASESVLGWVQTWNSCIGRFFSHTFGEPGYCFGIGHIDSILETYKSMNRALFGDEAEGDGGSAVQYLKAKISERFGVEDIPDAFMLLPEKMGGLGLRNPFIPLLVIREKLAQEKISPNDIIRKAFLSERDAYEAALKEFVDLEGVDERIRRLRPGYPDRDAYETAKKAIRASLSKDELNKFFSDDEYVRFIETTSEPLAAAYRRLVSTPDAEGPDMDADARAAMMEQGVMSWDDKPESREVRWALQMFAPELRDALGGLRLVEDNLLPLGVLAMMRKKAVRWNMVL